ncbi:MAG: LytTR family transcriptional regulator DNA-binding domain-containing protein [Eubacteriales bacterium]
MKEGDIQTFYHTLDQVELELIQSNIGFYRISQSLLVNPDAVYSHNRVHLVLKTGEEMGIAEDRRQKVRHMFCMSRMQDFRG